jgi:hypothetical protein
MLFDLDDPETLAALRGDVERIASDMDRDDRKPPMFWSGIPFPERSDSRCEDVDYCLIISVGGTKTEYALMRLEGGVPHIHDLSGREVAGGEAGAVRHGLRMPTPTDRDTRTGFELIERIAEAIALYASRVPAALERCKNVLLSWGFAHTVYRTEERVLGGLRAPSTELTKDQAGLSADLAGEDVGDLFGDALERRLGWRRPVTVANDAVMALHYFLGPESRGTHSRIGLFVNGTGTNFALAEPYAVRAEGVVSRPGERYVPRRITARSPARAGEHVEQYIVNYEAGSIELAATRSPYDRPADYPIEANAMSGGNAFEQQFREVVRARLGEGLHERLLARWRSVPGRRPTPAGPEVSVLASGGRDALEEVFPGAGLDAGTAEDVVAVARAVVSRSALHAGLILAAVTRRVGLGRGGGTRGDGTRGGGTRGGGTEEPLPDLLAMEGSVWKTPGYPEEVRGFWERLAGGALAVELTHEPSFNASLTGPLYLAGLHS